MLHQISQTYKIMCVQLTVNRQYHYIKGYMKEGDTHTHTLTHTHRRSHTHTVWHTVSAWFFNLFHRPTQTVLTSCLSVLHFHDTCQACNVTTRFQGETPPPSNSKAKTAKLAAPPLPELFILGFLQYGQMVVLGTALSAPKKNTSGGVLFETTSDSEKACGQQPCASSILKAFYLLLCILETEVNSSHMKIHIKSVEAPSCSHDYLITSIPKKTLQRRLCNWTASSRSSSIKGPRKDFSDTWIIFGQLYESNTPIFFQTTFGFSDLFRMSSPWCLAVVHTLNWSTGALMDSKLAWSSWPRYTCLPSLPNSSCNSSNDKQTCVLMFLSVFIFFMDNCNARNNGKFPLFLGVHEVLSAVICISTCQSCNLVPDNCWLTWQLIICK